MPWTSGIAVQRVDEGDEIALRRCCRKVVGDGPHSGSFRRSPLVAHVDLRGRILADEHDGKPRLAPALRQTSGDLVTDFAGQPCRTGLAVDDLGRHGSADLQHRPAHVPRVGGQDGVGIDGDRAAHVREERQVVERIAIGVGLAKIGEPAAARGEPRHETLDLALAQVGDAGRAARIAAIDAFGVGRDHVGDTELGGDRLGEKPDHCRRQDHEVTRVAMAIDQCARRTGNARPDPGRDEALAMSLQFRAIEPGERGQIELGELRGARLAAIESRDQVVVRRVVLAPIEHALVDQERDPLLVTVVREQRVIEVEQREDVRRHEGRGDMQDPDYNGRVIPAAIVTAIVERLTRELAPPRRRYRPLWVGRNSIGWLDDARASRIAGFGDVFDVRDDGILLQPGLNDAAAATAAFDRVARALAAENRLTAWRDERYPVVSAFGAEPFFLLERAAARFFGIHTYAAHVNGLVRQASGMAIWFARRSPAKAIDPGLLDNLVGGGIAVGQSIATTVVKEAWEEAGIAGELARQAQPAGSVEIRREQPDGLQRETIYVHDLWLPADFVPAGQDGEAVAHRLVSLPEAALLIANASGPDVVTADASLVVLDCLLRHEAIEPGGRDYALLEALRRGTT